MNLGGTEKAFINELKRYSEQDEVTVLLLKKEGELLKEIPDWVTVKDFPFFDYYYHNLMYHPKERLIESLRKGHLMKAIDLAQLHLRMKLTGDRRIQFKRLFESIPKDKTLYDEVHAYAGPMDFISYYAAFRTTGKKKIQWIHFDVNEIGFDPSFATKVYLQFDQIRVVSSKAADVLRARLPERKMDIIAFQTNIDHEEIVQRSLQRTMRIKNKAITIVTTGRMMKEKGPDLAIHTLKLLLDDGIDAEWYWIGGGKWTEDIAKLRKACNLEERFHMLGVLENPYPYMKQADIYVQPSRHEGFCLTIAEAKILQLPIVSTCTTGAVEQLKDDKSALLTGFTPDELAQGIKEAVRNKKDKYSMVK